MTEVWGGVLHIDKRGKTIEDVHLWNTNPSTPSLLPPDSSLHFLSNVYVSGVPLYMARGPPLEVSSDSRHTATWLHQNLLGDNECLLRGIDDPSSQWTKLHKQSEYGILLRVTKGKIDSAVTEVLIYAATHGTRHTQNADGGPFPSGSNEVNIPSTQQSNDELRVFALPLCSHVFDPVKAETSTSTSEIDATDVAHQKRRRLSNLFDDATRQRQRLAGRGGTRISKVLAGKEQIIKRHESQIDGAFVNGQESTNADLCPRQHRDSKIWTTSTVVAENQLKTASGSSKHNSKSSSLHRLDSTTLPRDESITPEANDMINQQNKAALMKLILAGMRLHGLQNKKRPLIGSDPQDPLHDSTSATTDAADEYKSVYHQTFKAALFALRNSVHNQILSQDTMRDVVDRLLGLFCAVPVEANTLGPGLQSTIELANRDVFNPFDAPSSSASLDHDMMKWTTPTKKKKHT